MHSYRRAALLLSVVLASCSSRPVELLAPLAAPAGPGGGRAVHLYVPDIPGTTVFTYTNDGTLWNEIDAEFVPGRGALALHPALIFHNGGSRYVFEAWRPATSNAWHHVEVKWQSGSVLWYLDGQLAFSMYRNTLLALGNTVVSTTASSMQIPAAAWPTQRQQVIANFWHGSATADASNFPGAYSGGSGTAIWNNLF